MAKSVAYPVVGLGVSTAALASGFDQAQAVAKAGMDKVASAVQSVSVRPLFDTSNITKGLESALSKVEEFKKKSASMDMIGKLSASQNPFFAMAQSGPKGKGPAVDMIGQLGEWQADKAARAKAQEEQAWQAQFNAKSQSIQAWLDKQARIDEAIKRTQEYSQAYWSNLRSVWTTGGNALLAVSGYTWGKIKAGFSAAINPLATLTRWSMPINQTLELAGKVNRVLGAPIRSAMAMEAGRDDVALGGRALLGSDSLSGTMARFARQVEIFFADIWSAIDRAFDVQGLLEMLRGGMAGVSAIIQSIVGPFEEIAKNPNALRDQFKAGGEFVIDVFVAVGQVALDMKSAFIGILKMIQDLPGFRAAFGEIVSEFTAEQEAKIRAFQQANMVRAPDMPGADRPFLAGPGGGLPPRAALPAMVPLNRADAIKQLKAMGELIDPIEVARNAINQIGINAKAGLGNAFVPNLEPKEVRDASLAIDDFTRSLRSANDSLYALELAAAQDAERIAQMENQGADPLDVFLAQSAADLAQGARVLEFAARQMPRDTAISAASQGSQALADALGRAMSTQSGRDIQSEIKSAIEEQVRQQQETNRLQMEALQIWNRFKPGQQVQVRGV